MDTQAQITLYETLTRELGLTEREITAHLPPALGAISREIGLTLTLKLIAHTRGKQIYLPGSATERCRLTQLIGIEAAAKVINLLGGDKHVVMSNPFNTRFMLRRRSINGLRQGLSINEVVERYGACYNSVHGWRKREGIPLQPRPIPAIPENPQKQVALKLLADGKNVTETAFLTGMSVTTIRVWKKSQGVGA